MCIRDSSTSTQQKIELDVKAGDKVRITSGPFADFVADIIEVYPDKSKTVSYTHLDVYKRQLLG